MMNVHAKPKTHPGGVQGALLRETYQSFWAGEPPISNPPKASAPKLARKKPKNRRIFLKIFKLSDKL
jgi:hypothetical protein